MARFCQSHGQDPVWILATSWQNLAESWQDLAESWQDLGKITQKPVLATYKVKQLFTVY